MRVISGICKGKQLKAVPGKSTRPTTDKVKEAIFNMVGPYFSGGIGLDLFAGSGGLGIEALSRGFEKMIFVDKDSKAIQTIHANIDFCGFREQSEVYRNDSFRALQVLKKRGIRFDGVFLDPPYRKQKLEELLSIFNNGYIKENGFIVCEHSKEVTLPARSGNLRQWKHETYGIIGVTIYRMTEDTEEKGD
ncbi:MULTISPECIES: 16S rRNA (guanine(966)-N(2))-methyltransferase RsmD [Bacillus]|jgi:16S rRNA (guanine966-N2)-methyltransferase|uniref:16S rRNA (guanine(966)-N(2))-methyltransferase RsmD n=1 Tax=Bacillus TaxID=1386 RepID=UPI00065E7280|nr:16S rRNA (guanine(966)-N(2))-methyltransferase RsmD [Bacillus smithii]AKP46745.1 Ribosomal RNA small subunit methyltransferase D [Bacillus smithii]MED1419183.1 16S rRNA (guanine(966)-N(2))-methyltransferase RsmD [Bacillus smithii]MED1456306.1 16S rRNA (guanine(966)-N(2))-methyltransferase RsmD [Bacillus smithii]MED1488214.1 16S rRNA (guanine(966)-N(2))-methyltransferase RsmD [Bacillus smithii]MED4882979.1 16S rRNA (guanine(966)-N(2))-methyltransferase RsmD [Bacillus smithii]